MRCLDRRLVLLQKRAREACASAIHALQVDLQLLLVQPEELEAFSAFLVTTLYHLGPYCLMLESAPAMGLYLARMLQSTVAALGAKHESNQMQMAAVEDVFRLMGSFDTKPAASDMVSPPLATRQCYCA